MRNIYLLSFIILIVFISCDTLPHEEGEAPFKGEIASSIYESKGENKIIAKVNIFVNANYYHKKSKKETFLLNVSTDSNEDIQKTNWSNDDNGDYYAFLIENSNRFDATTRLALYSFKDDKVVEMLDSKDVEISDFWFTDSTFVYELDAGVEEVIELD